MRQTSRFACVVGVMVVAAIGSGAIQTPGPDVFAFVRAMDEAGTRQVWPGFNPAEWPIALFDGSRTVLSGIPILPQGSRR